MSLPGPVMLDIEGTHLSQEDKELISSDQCGGLILFSRNFESASQVFDLTSEIKQLAEHVIIAVDQEGGRVQRFDHGFSQLPPIACLGQLYPSNPEKALQFASDMGELMALEVQAVGCDISFAPVLDLGGSLSRVIGDRGFSEKPDEIAALASAYMLGMEKAGMASTGKHFPGHGSVAADSHFEIPVDEREMSDIEVDLKPFIVLHQQLSAVMPAHVIYSKVDEQPAGFSEYWLKQVLRKNIGFDGVIFSDDLSMKGAEVAGDFRQRTRLALQSGCDMVLVCNDRTAALEVMDELAGEPLNQDSGNRLRKMLKRSTSSGLGQLQSGERWQELNESLARFNQALKAL